MPEVYESIILNGSNRNVEYLGVYVAWLVTNNLLSTAIVQADASSIARVRLQDLSGSAFLTTILHGELKQDHLSDTGRKFSEHYFVSGQYRADYNTCKVLGENDWHDYDEVSPKISAAFRKFNKPKPVLVKMVAKILKFPGRSK